MRLEMKIVIFDLFETLFFAYWNLGTSVFPGACRLLL